MPVPKKSKKIESTISKLDKLSKEKHKPDTKSPIEKKATKPETKFRTTLLLSRSVHERFLLALPQEKIKHERENKKIDKSTLIEKIIADWLDKNQY